MIEYYIRLIPRIILINFYDLREINFTNLTQCFEKKLMKFIFLR